VKALPLIQIRLLIIALAAWQCITVFGVWNIEAPRAILRVADIASLVAGIVAGAITLLTLINIARARPVTRAEPVLMWLLAINTVWPAFAIGVFALAGMLIPSLSARWEMEATPPGALIPTLVLIAIGSGVLHGLPALVLGIRLRLAVGCLPEDWYAHRATHDNRFNAIMGVSIVAGGWAGGAGLLGFLIRDSFSGETREAISIALVFGEGFGAFLGLLAGVFLALIFGQTRLDRSIPVVFGTGIAFGIVGSVLFFVGGIATASIGVFAAAIFARHRYKLIPPGQCQRCAYDLSGIDADACPECGTEFTPAPSRPERPVFKDESEPGTDPGPAS